MSGENVVTINNPHQQLFHIGPYRIEFSDSTKQSKMPTNKEIAQDVGTNIVTSKESVANGSQRNVSSKVEEPSPLRLTQLSLSSLATMETL
jgi:hypothetical protein